MTREEFDYLKDVVESISARFKNTKTDFYRSAEIIMYEDECKTLESAMSALSESKWIPVTERLPEEGKDVLFCDIDNDIMLGYHLHYAPATHFVERGAWEDVKNVRAWMPLPEPYKGGDV